MRIVVGLGLVMACVAGAACGGKEDRAPAVSTTGGREGNRGGNGNQGGDDGSGGEGGEGGASAGTDPLAPIVTVTSPEELEHPNDGDVVIGSDVEVLCKVTQSPLSDAEPVDPSSIKIELLDADGNLVEGLAGTPGGDDEYTATLQLGALDSGPVSFRCSASDIADEPHTASDTISTFVDHGPEIVVTEPAVDSAHALMGEVAFEFEVLPALLAEGDDGAAVDEVSLEVGGVQIAASEEEPGQYFGSVDFSNPALFPNTPSGSVPVIISASNSRAPTPVERIMSYNIVIDGDGPVIVISSHENEDVMGGKVVLAFTAVDELTSVNPDSVRVKIGVEEFSYDPNSPDWTKNGDAYTFSFDSRTITASVQTTLNVKAVDGAGNESDGASLTLYLDQYPPIVDLDPGNVREREVAGLNVYCSESFDPLGSFMPSDKGVVFNFMTAIRALVWDETNTTLGQEWGHMSGTNRDSVYVYIQPDPSTPLLIDTDGNDTCDNIDESLDLEFIHLEALSENGDAWNNAEALEEPLPALCTMQDVSSPPLQLCEAQASDLRRVIGHETPLQNESVIYAHGSLTGVECTGGGWGIDVLVQDEGWICLAGVATDNVGNRGVSPPLRLCYDNPDTLFQPACVNDPDSAPACVVCSPPPGFTAQIIDVP